MSERLQTRRRITGGTVPVDASISDILSNFDFGLEGHLDARKDRLGLAVERGGPGLEAALPPHQKWLARRLEHQARRWSSNEIDHALETGAQKATGVAQTVLSRVRAKLGY